MAVPNPDNKYIPAPGEQVRVVSACHPLLLGKVVTVVNVAQVEDGHFCEIEYDGPDGESLYTCGLLGGLEPL